MDESGGGAPIVFRRRRLGLRGGAWGSTATSVLYWGDHTYGDILRSKKSVGWRTAMIIPELEEEISTVTERAAGRASASLDDAIEQRVAVLRDEQRTQAGDWVDWRRVVAGDGDLRPGGRGSELASPHRDSLKERLAHLDAGAGRGSTT